MNSPNLARSRDTMAKSKFSLAPSSAAAVSRSTAAIVAESMAPGMDEHGKIWIVFRGSEGKGTGEQHVPMTEMLDLIYAVSEIVEDGAPEEGQLTAAEMFRRTFALRDAPEGKDGQYCTFRMNDGKGAKPVTIPYDDLGKFYVALLNNLPLALGSVKNIKGVSQEAIDSANVLSGELPQP